jgi:hypothetical protein
MTHGRMTRWVAGGAVALAVMAGVAWAADLWSRLGVTEARAKTEWVQAFAGGNVPFYLAAKAVMATPPAARAALVVEGLEWVKRFAGSAEFKTAYAALRQERKPDAPVSKGTPEQQAKAQQDEQRKSLDEARKNIATLPPETRKEMEATLKQMEETIKKTAADPKVQAMMKEMAAIDAKEAQDQYKTRLAEWERDYPADGSALVASRLRKFLEVCGDVDYAAKLTSRDGKKHFVDQRFQEKSSEWKLCFRAGRETTEAARTFAKAWLGELTKK